MINVDDIKEHEQASGILPPLYTAWIANVIEGPLPTETKATCSNCVMCQPANKMDGPNNITFNPATKCCTWLPELPNFLVGRILSDDSPDMREGRISVEERLRKGAAVSPLGFAQDTVFKLAREEERGYFGRNSALRCPHYIEEGGRCGIWKHRYSVCSTWFCKHERGAAGRKFWNVIKHLLCIVENNLAAWCAYQLDVKTEMLANLLTQPRSLLGDDYIAPKFYRAVWGKWAGHEQDFFKECASLVNPLSWDEICAICGSQIAIFIRFAQETYASLQSKTIPPLLQVLPYREIKVEQDYSQVITYNRYDPVRLSNDLKSALQYFDGRPLDAVQQAIKTERNTVLNENLVHKLIDFRLLGPVTEKTEEAANKEALPRT